MSVQKNIKIGRKENMTIHEETQSLSPYIITQHEVKKAFYFIRATNEEEAYQKHRDRETKCVGEEYVSVYDKQPLSIEELKQPTEIESQYPNKVSEEG
jgi:hypothetical protein